MSVAPSSVSVLLAVRDGEPFLAEALASIRGQTRPPEEILVIDDGSTDGTKDVALAFPGMTYLRQEPAGQASALNHGLRHARGEFVGFLDADDLWLPSKLERQLEVLQSDPTIDALFGAVEHFFDAGLKDCERRQLPPPEPSHLLGTVLVRRAFLDRPGPLREDLAVGAGLDWYARWRHAGVRESTLPEIVLRRRVHHGNIGRSLSRPDGYFAALRAHLKRTSAP